MSEREVGLIFDTLDIHGVGQLSPEQIVAGLEVVDTWDPKMSDQDLGL